MVIKISTTPECITAHYGKIRENVFDSLYIHWPGFLSLRYRCAQKSVQQKTRLVDIQKLSYMVSSVSTLKRVQTIKLDRKYSERVQIPAKAFLLPTLDNT